ncbi:pyridoxal phosphate-dependent decarboxylase family protein [Ornithinimicrobium sp. LYQ103]|uniref:pyridoxal phosphate-dependent decarboxylase family protein n=1 Tax=Ornithinimicrobium sp. LYQ103 TaxID=3378796 RepID=UPI00385305C8
MTGSQRPELDAAVRAAERWLDSVWTRRVPAERGIDEIAARIPGRFPRNGRSASEVVEELAEVVEPGLMAIGSPRFYGWVMGGTLPAALAADWMVSAWDQNAGMRDATPGVVAVEDAAARWILEALGFPTSCAVSFVTGGTMANFTALAAARDSVLSQAGWNQGSLGLSGGPRVRVLAGAERHGSIDLALRYLGLGEPELVAVDPQGCLDASALREALATSDGPTIVCAQAGNIHSGAFDPFGEVVAAAREIGAWVHVDGAFGLWAATVPALAGLVAGLAEADSWATDAHKTLNTPYDGGIALVRDPVALARAFGHGADYLLHSEIPDPHEKVPELSRRARGVPIWGALDALGRDGLVELVRGLVEAAQGIATGLAELPGVRVLNDVVYTQVTISVNDDATTRAVLATLMEEGTVHPSGSRWHDRDVIRFSVSNHATDAASVADTVDAVRRAIGKVA